MALNLINTAYAAGTAITATKNCPDNGIYAKGLLKGLSCSGPVNSLDTVLVFIKNLVSGFLLPIVGTLFVIMIIIGGILYTSSGGNPERAKKAKGTITAAIVGLIIVILAYTLIAIFARALGGAIS